jgi:thiol-disulfide isomerase/thioredoxin
MALPIQRLITRRRMLETALIIAAVVAVQLWQTRGLPAGAAPPLAGMRSDGVATSLVEFQKPGADETTALPGGRGKNTLPRRPGLPLRGQGLLAVADGNTANKPVLVVFWATWCGVCKAEEHNIVAVAQDWPVFSVAMQSGDAAAVTKHLQERGVPFPALVDSEGVNAAAWRISGVPTHFIVDADGKVRFRVVGYATEWGLRARLWWAQRFSA